jgi:16S rRNA (guanine527-N7)-methyltransferase
MPKEKLLIRGLKKLNITPSEAQVSAFMSYLSELKRWNRAYSLTSLETDRDIIIKHFLDSCLYLYVLKKEPFSSVADVGSGAGFPGIPMKILRPEIEMYLIEPSEKKSAFLRHIIRTLSLENITLIEKRLEDTEDIEVDVAVTRALYKTQKFIKKASHIVKKGGLFILNKGPKVKEELKYVKTDYKLRNIKLPLSDITRYFVIVRKEKD